MNSVGTSPFSKLRPNRDSKKKPPLLSQNCKNLQTSQLHCTLSRVNEPRHGLDFAPMDYFIYLRF